STKRPARKSEGGVIVRHCRAHFLQQPMSAELMPMRQRREDGEPETRGVFQKEERDHRDEDDPEKIRERTHSRERRRSARGLGGFSRRQRGLIDGMSQLQ